MSYRLPARSADNLERVLAPVARALNIPHESISASMPHWPCPMHTFRELSLDFSSWPGYA